MYPIDTIGVFLKLETSGYTKISLSLFAPTATTHKYTLHA